MRQVFADTLYWVASITPGDPWYAPTLQAVAALGPAHLVTTEEVLVEFLSVYSLRYAPAFGSGSCPAFTGTE